MDWICGKKGDACFCGQAGQIEAQTTLPEENAIFNAARRMLSSPSGCGNFPYTFYFHVLDGHRHSAVSLGFDSGAKLDIDAASNYEARIREAFEVLPAWQAGKQQLVDIVDLLQALNLDANGFDVLLKSAQSYVASHGQPLSKNPSRLEQCLTLKTATMDQMSKLSPEFKEFSLQRFYWVDDYLGRDTILDKIYRGITAPKHFNFGGNGEAAAEAPEAFACTSETAPFLAAEHLGLLAAEREAYTHPLEHLADFKNHRPGIVIMPFKVLGQYRAAGVWFYRGHYDSERNAPLRDHLNMISKFADEWLSLTIGQMVLHASNIQIIRALNNVQGIQDMPLIDCARVQRAFLGLWFSRRVEFWNSNEKKLVRENSHAETVSVSTERMQKISVNVDPQVAKILGFDRIDYNACPFFADLEVLESESSHVEQMLRNVNAVLVKENQAARREERNSVRDRFSVTSHQYANMINELTFLVDNGGKGGQGLAPQQLLGVLRRSLSHMRGFAWITRALYKQESREEAELNGSDIGRLAGLSISSADPPKASDIETWRAFLYWEALFTAYASLMKFGGKGEGDRGTVRLTYDFQSVGCSAGDELTTNYSTHPLVNEDALRQGIESGNERARPRWPFAPEDGADENSKLDDLGRCSVTLWPLNELIRNASEEASRMAMRKGGEQGVGLSAEIRNCDGGWRLEVVVRNTTDQRPPKVADFPWYKKMRSITPHVRLEDIEAPDGQAAYAFILGIGNENS